MCNFNFKRVMFGNFSVSELTLSPLCINRSQIQIKQPLQRSYQHQIMALLNLLHYRETRSVLSIYDLPGCFWKHVPNLTFLLHCVLTHTI